jgi:transketolase
MLGDVNAQDQEIAIKEIAKKVVLAAHLGEEGHIPSALSILDILYSIYFSNEINLQDRDDFILSKGHASLGYYAVLSAKGVIGTEWEESFGKYESDFGGHPHRLKVPQTLASTGSLGHGLPIGTGIAYAKKILDIEGDTFVLVGDGELNEGTSWESSLFAIHHNLNRLKLIVDLNKSGDRAINLSGMSEKLAGLGWNVFTVDGHDVEQMREVLEDRTSSKPTAIIANTIKGYRIKEMENNPAWHHTKIDALQTKAFLAELS